MKNNEKQIEEMAKIIGNTKYQSEEDFSKAYDLGSKETAEKIYKKIKDSFLMNSNNRYALKLWIEEQFGLEIKE